MRKAKNLLTVLLSCLMILTTAITPVEAKGGSANTNGWNPWGGWFWGWGWGWQQPEPEPSEEPVVEEEEPAEPEEPEEPAPEETPAVEEPAEPEEPVTTEEPVSEEFPAATFEDTESSEIVNVSIDAPEGAFTTDTVMSVDPVTEEEAQSHMVAAVQTLECSEIVDSRILNISFANEEGEQEPNVPVTVTVQFTTPLADAEGYAIVHINDDGTAELIQDAVVTPEYATFTANAFSVYEILAYTNRHSEVDVAGHIVFNPSNIPGASEITKIASGDIAANAPKFDEYTFVNATTMVDGQEVEIVQIGAFTAVYDVTDDNNTPDDPSDDTTTTREEYNVYYRTAETMESSDIIVLIAGQSIVLNYEATPLSVTYRVVYDGTTYTIGTDTLPEELADVVLSGPEYVKQREDYPVAVTAAIPRGYSAILTMNNTEKGRLGGYTEPTYTVNSENKIITKTGELALDGKYDINSTTANQVVTLTITKRTSYTFDASKFLSTVYTGGSGANTMGDSAVNTNSNARITGDGSLGRSGTNKGKKTFTGNEVSWSFTTNNTENSHWLLDALQINGTDINVPYGESGPVSKTTNLPSGAVVTVTLNSVTGTGRNAKRNYTISVTNVYEDVVISGGNIYNADNSTEIITEVLQNVDYSFYGFSSSDNAYSSSVRPAWITWGEGEPIAVGTGNLANSGTWDMYRFGQTNNNAMRFTVKQGYVNPEIAYVTSTEGDLHSYVALGNGLSFGSMSDSNGKYYPVNGNPTNGTYYFRITGIGNSNKLALLRIRATLARYGVSYSGGSVTGAVVPEFDNGGLYGDGTLQGYNVEDNDIIVLNKIVPTDPTGEYVFVNYTISGGGSTTYAPGQKINLTDVMNYAAYDSSKGEYVIPFVANWVKAEEATKVTVKVKFYLDGEFEREVDVQVIKNSSVYIDIDSEEMTKFMTDYDWQLFYDEMGSNPYIERAESDTEVTLHVYSKFYVYHSSTGNLELHTTKEMLQDDGMTIGTLDITKYIPDNYLYGGYYQSYGGASGTFVKADGTTSETVENAIQACADDNNDNGTLTALDVAALSGKKAVVIGEGIGTTYDGSSLAAKNKVTNKNVKFWTKSQAFTTAPITARSGKVHGPDKSGATPLTEGGTGTAMTPARACVYYLKEVPAYYLTPYMQWVYDYNTMVTSNIYLLSTCDDTNYKAVGDYIKTNNYTAKTASTLTITRRYEPAVKETIKPSTVNAKVKRGYLTIADVSGKIAELPKNEDVQLIPYWTTMDEVEVTTKMTKLYNFGANANGDEIKPVSGE